MSNGHPELEYAVKGEVGRLRTEIERLRASQARLTKALVEIEYHSADKNAAATARAALALDVQQKPIITVTDNPASEHKIVR